VAVVPLPADHDAVSAAIHSLRGAALLTGGRGSTAVDLDALVGLAVAAGRVLIDQRLALVELNPVIATAHTAVAVDAVVRRA